MTELFLLCIKQFEFQFEKDKSRFDENKTTSEFHSLGSAQKLEP